VIAGSEGREHAVVYAAFDELTASCEIRSGHGVRMATRSASLCEVLAGIPLLKGLINRAAHRAGLHFGKFPPRHSLVGHLGRLFESYGVNCVLDVGGHHGEFALQLREAGYRGRIVSFEPIRATHAILASKARTDRDWRVLHLALGADEGEKEMKVYRGTVFNSFLDSNEFAANRFGRSVELEGSEPVRMRRLDQILADCVDGIAKPRVFLKMDTQGWDLEVLEGARGVLGAIVGIQTEIAIKHCYHGMTSYQQALDRCESFGFELAGIFPVAFAEDGLRLVEVDCVFVAGG
jgi:FkbM family methyltransferase